MFLKSFFQAHITIKDYGLEVAAEFPDQSVRQLPLQSGEGVAAPVIMEKNALSMIIPYHFFPEADSLFDGHGSIYAAICLSHRLQEIIER